LKGDADPRGRTDVLGCVAKKDRSRRISHDECTACDTELSDRGFSLLPLLGSSAKWCGVGRSAASPLRSNLNMLTQSRKLRRDGIRRFRKTLGEVSRKRLPGACAATLLPRMVNRPLMKRHAQLARRTVLGQPLQCPQASSRPHL
jgi:hypothetical protein